MSKLAIFGLACEGATDHITIETILCGYFRNPDLDAQIARLSPPLDKATQKQIGFGGWGMQLDYLKSPRFKNDLITHNFIIVQLDTDISKFIGVDFHLPQKNADNKELSPEELINYVVEKLINIIDSEEAGFYQQHAEQIIFAVSVHSLECWLYAYHNKEKLNKPKIAGCHKALSHLLKDPIEKTVRRYEKLCKDFLKRKHIDVVIEKDPSFYVFAQSLEKIEPVVLQLIAELD